MASEAFRRLAARDVDALTDLFVRNDIPDVTQSFDPFPLTRKEATNLLLPTRLDRFYGAFAGERMAAFSMLRGWEDGYEIPSFGIFVDRLSQGCGLGTRLTGWTIGQARLAGAPAVRLS